jgi:hypothetical protein
MERFGKDGQKPSLTFGPCSGNVMVDVREKMLEQGDAKDTSQMGSMIGPILRLESHRLQS